MLNLLSKRVYMLNNTISQLEERFKPRKRKLTHVNTWSKLNLSLLREQVMMLAQMNLIAAS